MELSKKKLAKRAMETLKQTIKDMDWEYEIDEDDPWRITCSGMGEELPIHLILRVDPQRLYLSLLSPIDLKVPTDKGSEMAFALCIINDALSNGSFDFHMQNGTVWFRMTNLFRDVELTTNLCEYFLNLAVHTIDAFNDKLMMVSNGLMDVQEVFDLINGDDEDD